ncbi:unnamed protein product [Somion occarium]
MFVFNLVYFLVLAIPTLALSSSSGKVFRSVNACPVASSIPSFNDSKLPNPFVFNNGHAVHTREAWDCRRRQISALIQGYEAGTLPPRPPHVSAAFSKSGTAATLNVTAGLTHTNQISFAPTITYPTGDPPAGGWPLVIAYDGLSIPIPPGIATMIYSNSQMAQQNDQSSRGQGLFYELYGQNATASSMTAWVWGISRIIDALELTPAANINLGRIAVTGCSRDGKGALMAGAFEERIALTIPQESGSGGDTCWRLSKFEQDSGNVVQEAVEIVQENVWFSTNFDNFVHNISVLPYDHHFLAGMIAPRAMISFENTDFVWLSPMSSFGCMTAAHTIWQALGVPDNHGFVQVGGHAHCAFPSTLNDQLFAFINKFLLGQNTNTSDILTTNGVFGNATWQPSDWITWSAHKLV